MFRCCESKVSLQMIQRSTEASQRGENPSATAGLDASELPEVRNKIVSNCYIQKNFTQEPEINQRSDFQK